MCGLTLDIGTRIIGCIGFAAALVVMMQLGSQLKREGEGKEEEGVQVRPLLGVTVEELHPQSAEQVSGILVSFLIFATSYACSSCLLVYASIVRNQLMAVPWLTCEAVSFSFHVISATIGTADQTTITTRAACSLAVNFVVTAYFWGLVFCAMLSWTPKNMEEGNINSTPKRADYKIKLPGTTSPSSFASPV